MGIEDQLPEFIRRHVRSVWALEILLLLKRTPDRAHSAEGLARELRATGGLLLAFAIAFWLMAAGQLVTGALGLSADEMAPVYLLRLAAFSLIVLAIVGKNLSDRSSR